MAASFHRDLALGYNAGWFFNKREVEVDVEVKKLKVRFFILFSEMDWKGGNSEPSLKANKRALSRL